MAMAMASGKVDCAVCVVVVGWLFFGSGCGLCHLWCLFLVVCIIFLEWIYYFIIVDILFYCDVYVILLC